MSSPHPFGLQHAIAARRLDDPWQATVAAQARLLTPLLTPWTAAAARLRRHPVPLAPRHAAQLAALAAQTRQQLTEAAALPQRIERDIALLRGMGNTGVPMPPAAAARLAAMAHAVDVLHANLVTARCPGYARLRPASAVAFASEAEAQQAGYRKAKNCP